MPQTVEVRFKGTRKAYFTWADEAAPLKLQEAVIVEVERGKDFGRITATGDVANRKCTSCSTSCAIGEGPGDAPAPSADEPLKLVLRRATLIRHVTELRKIRPEKLVKRRAEKYAAMGVFTEA